MLPYFIAVDRLKSGVGQDSDSGETVQNEEPDILIRTEKSLEPFAKALSRDWKVSVTPIPVDFVLPTDKDFPIAIERKTTGDFIGSIKTGRLVEQLRAMRELSDDCYILLEGSWSWIFSEKNRFRSYFNPASVVGYIDVVDKFGVRILPMNNITWSVVWLDKRLRDLKGVKKKHLFKLRPSASRDLSPSEQAQYIAEGFPGLGPKGIEEVKSAFSCLGDFVEWMNLDGSSQADAITSPDNPRNKLSTRLRNLFDDDWRTILWVKWNERNS